MAAKKEHYTISLLNVYRLTTQVIVSEPKLWAPFFLLMLLELGAVILAYVAPREPFIQFFGPPISTFFGEIFLHYPAHLLLVPLLAVMARYAITVLIGPLLLGTAVSMLGQSYKGRKVYFWRSLKTSFFRYIQIFFIISLIFISAYFVTHQLRLFLRGYFAAGHEQLFIFGQAWWWGPFMTAANFAIALIAQALLIYSIPMVLIDNVKLFPALVQAIAFFLRRMAKTLFMIALPMLLYLPVMILLLNAPTIVNRFIPDAVFGICIAAALLNWLLVELLTIVSLTFAYLEVKYRR